MKKNKYVCPEVSVYDLEVQNMLALSRTDSPADSKSAIETNEFDDKFTDIWGNEF